MEHYSHDAVKRMQEIKRVLDGGAIASTAAGGPGAAGGGGGGTTHHPTGGAHPTAAPPPASGPDHAAPAALDAKVALLDELVELVENIDTARDLALIGGLPTLLSLLAAREPALRSRAAEVLGTAAQSNPPVQDWFLEGGVLEAVLGMLGGGGGGGGGRGPGAPPAPPGGGDPCPAARKKALFALSCLVRHCERATDALVEGGGIAVLVHEASGEACAGRPAAARKAWQLLSYLATARPGVAGAAAHAAGVGPALATAISLPGGDAEVRGAAVACAAALGEGGGRGAVALAADAGLVSALRAVAGGEGGEGGDAARGALAALEGAAEVPAGGGSALMAV